MKEKRRDSKGRILHTGESQRTDGKYLYKYVDAFGNTKYVYAWRLTPTDPTPKGKREKPSLRELEQQIRRDIEDGIDSTGKKMTLCQLYAKQNAQRANVKKSTQKQREQLMRLLKEDKLGARSIDTIKPSDAKEWALRMKDKGFSYNTINNHKRSLKASFYIAIQDDCVRKNPFDFKLSEVLENDTKEKVALTEEQEQALLSFIKTDNVYHKYYDDVLILLKTGLRISELCGLTIMDVDFIHEVAEVREVKVGDGVVGAAHLSLDIAGLVELGVALKVDGLVAKDGGLEGGAGAGAGLAVENDDSSVVAADLLPVGDLAGEDALELLEGQVVDCHVLGDDGAHAHDGDLVIDEVLDLIGLELGLGEDIGITDGDGAGGDSGQALARTVTRTGDGDVRVGIHELLGSSLDESLERGGAVVGHLARDGLGSSGAALSSGVGGVGAAATNETETDDAGKTTSEAEELTTRISLIEHDLPFIQATRGHPARFAVWKDTVSIGQRPRQLRFITGI